MTCEPTLPSSKVDAAAGTILKQFSYHYHRSDAAGNCTAKLGVRGRGCAALRRSQPDAGECLSLIKANLLAHSSFRASFWHELPLPLLFSMQKQWLIGMLFTTERFCLVAGVDTATTKPAHPLDGPLCPSHPETGCLHHAGFTTASADAPAADRGALWDCAGILQAGRRRFRYST